MRTATARMTLVLFVTLSIQTAIAADKPPADPLDKRVAVAFDAITPAAAIRELATTAEVRITIDNEDELPRTKVWIHAEDISLRCALRLILSERYVGIESEESRVHISLRDDTATTLQLYPLEGLADRDEHGYLGDEVIELLTNCVRPNDWDEVGGFAQLRQTGSSLVVSHTTDTHREIRLLLNALREARDSDSTKTSTKPIDEPKAETEIESPPNPFDLESASDDNPFDAPAAHANPFNPQPPQRMTESRPRIEPIWAMSTQRRKRELQVRKLLSKEVNEVEIFHDSLPAALKEVSQLWSAPLAIESESLATVSGQKAALVSVHADRMTLAEALETLLKPYDMEFDVCQEVIVIAEAGTLDEYTAQDCYGARVVYPVGDLVAGFQGDDVVDADSLIETLIMAAPYDSWDEVGGRWVIDFYFPANTIVVDHRTQVHDKILDLLTKLRAAQGSARQIAAARSRWEKELVWQGFRWNPAGHLDGFGGEFGGLQGGFFAIGPERIAQAGNASGQSGFGGPPPASQANAPKPPEPMSKEEQQMLIKLIKEAMPAGAESSAKLAILARDHEVLVRHERKVMIEIEKRLSKAPVSRSSPPNWIDPRRRAWPTIYPSNVVPVVGQETESRETQWK